MPNLALNKLPLEKEYWQRAEEATDGIISNYTGTNGFASGKWPVYFTIDLETEKKISNIRFLLWDNLGNPNNRKDSRKYKFALSISSDNKTFTTIFSNEHADGGNGWFSFNLTNEPYLRYVRLIGIHNTANPEFHIVEFEIYDNNPPELVSPNVQNFNIVALISEQKITELISSELNKRSEPLRDIDDKIKNLDRTLERSGGALKQIELIKKSIDFQQESIDNNTRANNWLRAAVLSVIIFLTLLYWFFFCDNYPKKIILNAAANEATKTYTTLFLAAYYTTKAILLSTLLFIFGWFLKNYRSEKHNYIINKHKAMSLTVATGILTNDEYKNADRESIFNQAMEIIFSHQSSGFSKEESNSPSIVNTLHQKLPKIES